MITVVKFNENNRNSEEISRNNKILAKNAELSARLESLSKRYSNLLEKLNVITERNMELEKYVTNPDLEIKFSKFLEESNVILPKKVFQKFFQKVEETHESEVVNTYKEHLEKTNHREIFEQLFSEELLYTRSNNYSIRLKENTAFFQGSQRLETAKKKDVHLHQMMEKMLKITDNLLSRIIRDDDFQSSPKKILEIGGAWGATIKHLTERFHPIEYQNYEIDSAYAKWAEETFGAKPMPVDGETLSATEDQSMDLVIANNVLFFIPPIKVWNYLTEMGRVTANKGVIVFNAIVPDLFKEEQLEYYLRKFFPRRAFSFTPQKFIELSFPKIEFELIRSEQIDPDRPFLPYYFFRRIN